MFGGFDPRFHHHQQQHPTKSSSEQADGTHGGFLHNLNPFARRDNKSQQRQQQPSTVSDYHRKNQEFLEWSNNERQPRQQLPPSSPSMHRRYVYHEILYIS